MAGYDDSVTRRSSRKPQVMSSWSSLSATMSLMSSQKSHVYTLVIVAILVVVVVVVIIIISGGGNDVIDVVLVFIVVLQGFMQTFFCTEYPWLGIFSKTFGDFVSKYWETFSKYWEILKKIVELFQKIGILFQKLNFFKIQNPCRCHHCRHQR